MPTLAELYPELYGLPAQTLQQNKPGLATSFKGALYGYPAGLGRGLEDAGLEGIGASIRKFGEEGQQRNPSSPASQSFEGFFESPWQGTKEIVGQGLGYTLPAIIPYVGPAGRALGPAGAATAGAGLSAVPSYGHIRATQDQMGISDPTGALLGAGAVGAIEQIGGVQSLLRPGMQGVVGNMPRHLLGDLRSTPLRTGLSTANRVALGEGLEEIAQNPIEQYAGGQDPWEADRIHETLFGGFSGYVGGMLPFGAGAGLRRAGQHMGAQQFVDQTLGNSNAGMDLQMDALEIQQQFIGDQQLYQQQLQALNEQVYQGMLRGEPVNMLQPTPTMPNVMEAPWHAGLGAMPQGTPIETDFNRAAGILQTASQLPEEQWDSQMVRDVEMASALLQRSLPQQQYDAFVNELGLSGGNRAQPVTPTTSAPRGSAPRATGQAVSQPSPTAKIQNKPKAPVYASPYEQAYVESGGIYSPVKAKLGQAKTNEEALAVVRDVLENKKPSQKVLQALEEVHKKLSGQTMTQYLRAREAQETDPRKPGPVTITKGDPNAQANVPLQEVRQEASAGQVPGQKKVKTEQDYRRLQAKLNEEEKRTGLYLADENIDRENVLVEGRTDRDADYWDRMYDAAESAALFRREDQRTVKGATDATRQTALQGAAVVEKAGAQPVQAVQTKARPEDQGAGREANRQQGQAQQVKTWEEQEPEDVQNFVLEKVAAQVGAKKTMILKKVLGWGEERSSTYEEVAEFMVESGLAKNMTRQNVGLIWKDLTRSGGAVDQVMSEHGIEPQHVRPKETTDEKPEGPAQPTSSLVARPVDAAAAGITDPEAEAGAVDRNTGFTTGDISKVNSSNIQGELSTTRDKETGDVTGYASFTPDQEGQANERAAAFEQAQAEEDVEGEAITVWDSYAHIQAAQGEDMRNWDQLAKTERGRDTQEAWVEFYTKQKEVANETKRNAGMLRRLRATLKKAYYSRDLSYAQFLEQSGRIEQVSFGSNPFLLDAIRRRFAAGLGPMITEKLHGVFVVDNLPGDAGAGKFDELNGKYILAVKRSVWELRPGSRWDMMLERLFHHEIEHILDDSAQGKFGNYSSDPALAPGGVVYEEVSSLWITDRGLFAYPMDTEKYKGIEEVQQKELYAQIMSAYHTPALRERLRKFPLAHKLAEIYDEEIRADVAKRRAGTRTQSSATANQAGGRMDASINSRDDGLPEREAFKPQLHEGFAKAVEEVALAVKSGDRVRERNARSKTIPIGRTPVVLRAITTITGEKVFRKSDFVIGNGSTIYLKGQDEHQASTHGWAVPVETLKRLPQLLADPVAVFRSGERSSDSESYKVVLDAEVAGKPVIAAIKPNRPQQEFGGETAHFTVTLFPLRNGWSQVDQWNDLGLLRYYDDKRAPAVQPGTNPQGLTGARGTKPDFSVGVAKSPVKVATKSQIEQTPKAFYSQGLEEAMRDYPAELKPGAGMVRDYIKDAVTNWAKKGLQAVVFSHDLANIAVKEGLSSAKGFFDLINAKAAKRIELEAQVDRIMTAAADLTDRTAVNDFLRDSTRGQKWGYVPSWKPDVEVDSVLEQRYNRLSELGKKTVDAVFRRGEESYAEKQRLVNQEINDEFDAQLLKAGTQDERDAIEKARAKQVRAMGRVLPKLQGPYAPFKRFGNYVSVAKSEAYLDAVAMNDTKLIEELQQDDRHYLVEFHDSFPAAKARARQLQPFFHSAKGFERQQLHREVQELPWGAIAKVKQHIADMPDDAKHKAALSRLLTDIYLTMLSEGSARKAELRRRGIHGEERNMLQSFAAQGRADAHFISALEKNGEIQKQISAMQTEAKQDEENRNRVLNEILARYAQAVDYRPTPWTNKAMAMTSFWMLVTTPSYYLQNSTQPFMLTLPVLSGRFGNGAAWAALTKAYKDVARFFRDVGHGLDIDKLPLSEDERAMLRTLRDQGKIDLTIAQDLGRWAEGEGILDKGKFGKVLRKIWAAPHQVEMLNRVTSALAAYRLSKGSLEYTSKIIDDTHGNYAASNAPRFMHANAALRLITQFRKFQLIQISLLGKTLYNAFKGTSPEERAVAKASLGWLLAHHMVMAGALGLPTANLIGWLLSAAFGDDDEPKDFERMVRRAIGDEDLSNLILRGVPAGLGLDVSGRIGMGTAFALLPFSKVDLLGKRDAMESVAGAAGAFPSVLLGISEGADYLRRGDIYKGFELMLPRGLRDAVRAYRFATEGISQKNNDVVMKPSELSMFDVMSQAVGLPSTALQARSRRVGDVFETDEYYKDRTGTMRHRYAAAYRENDLEEMRDLREEWAQVAAAMRRQGLKPQPLSNLLKAPRDQAKREKDTVEGVQTKKSNREFVRQGAQL